MSRLPISSIAISEAGVDAVDSQGRSKTLDDFVGQRHHKCSFCSHDYRNGLSECPHCGRPRNYTNVQIAESSEEVLGLHSSFIDAKAKADAAGTTDVFVRFERLMAKSKAVMNCPPEKLLPIVTRQVEVYANFLELSQLRCSASPDKKNYPGLRVNAENNLLECDDFTRKVHYASLSLTNTGLTSYGSVALTLDEAMTKHRISIFPFNSALYFESREQGPPPAGLRVTWENRGKAAAVKHAGDLTNSMTDSDFTYLVLHAVSKPDGTPDRDKDVLMEAHVLGPMTMRTFSLVVCGTKRLEKQPFWKQLLRKRPEQTDQNADGYQKHIRDYCAQYDIPFQTVEA